MKIQLNVFLLFIFQLCAANVSAWVEPVDFNLDLGASGASNSYIIDETTHMRCDSGQGGNKCHRWGLILEKNSRLKESHETNKNWTTKVDEDTHRLPTIKELVRLYDYTGGGLDSTIKKWFDEAGDDKKKTWIISSSYRDIDGNYDGTGTIQYLQIFALNVGTGEVKTFLRDGLALCESLTDTGSAGSCDATETTQIIHTIKVQRDHIKEQCINAGLTFTETGCPTTP